MNLQRRKEANDLMMGWCLVRNRAMIDREVNSELGITAHELKRLVIDGDITHRYYKIDGLNPVNQVSPQYWKGYLPKGYAKARILWLENKRKMKWEGSATWWNRIVWGFRNTLSKKWGRKYYVKHTGGEDIR